MKKIFVILLFLSINSFGQNHIEYKGEFINALDENNEKTGIWKLYNEEENIIITTEFKNGNFIANTNYYKDSKLVASYKYHDNIEIYKDSKTIKAKFFRKADKSQTLIDPDGKELDSDILKFFYSSGQVMPMYYGGNNQLYDFIKKNIDYKSIKKNKGKVKVGFVIDAKGNTSEIEIVESTNAALNEEAKRIVGILPRWQPAHQGGAFVKCPYMIPITFN